MNKTIVIDVDGTLTDGGLYIGEDGEKVMKRFHVRDVNAIRDMIKDDWKVILVSADDSDFAKHFANKVGADFVYARDKGILPFEYLAAVGDSELDYEMLIKAKYAFHPHNADRMAMPSNCRPLPIAGGHGIMPTVHRWLIKAMSNKDLL